MQGEPPAAIIASVGGGGLFIGLQMGLERHGLSHVPVLAVETEGAASLANALKLGENLFFPKITSIATSLGARKVADKCFELGQRPNVRSVVLTDAQAALACVQLANDERLIVEAACGVSVACCYEGIIKQTLPHLRKDDKVVVIVCGGSNVNLSMLVSYPQYPDSRLWFGSVVVY